MGEPRRWKVTVCHQCGVILYDQERIDKPTVCSHLSDGPGVNVRDDQATEADIEAILLFLYGTDPPDTGRGYVIKLLARILGVEASRV